LRFVGDLESARIPTVGQWDLSLWDEDVWASEGDSELIDRLMEAIFPGARSNELRQRSRLIDVGHLVGHLRAGRDIFVTNEKAFLAQGMRLVARFGIRVSSSSDAVEYVRRRQERESRIPKVI
jgi:hypothetical protein